jgi:tetratricopeptide (TPR) repeat protein
MMNMTLSTWATPLRNAEVESFQRREAWSINFEADINVQELYKLDELQNRGSHVQQKNLWNSDMTRRDKSPDNEDEGMQHGGIGADLEFSPGHGVTFKQRTRKGLSFSITGLTAHYELIRIDGELIKGLTLQEMAQRSRGPVGSKVEIEIKQYFLEVPERLILTRVNESELAEDDCDYYETLQKTASVLDKIYSFNSRDFSSQASQHKKLTDFETTEALYRLAAERAPDCLDAMEDVSTLSHLAALGWFLISIGHFESVKEVSNNVLSVLLSEGLQTQSDSTINKFVAGLANGIDEVAAEEIYKQLIETCATKNNDTYPYTGYQFEYARFLTERKRFEEANIIIEELLVTDPLKHHYQSHSHLTAVADLLQKQGKLGRACDLYELAIQKYYAHATESVLKSDKLRTVSLLLRKIIVTHLLNENFAAADLCVQRSIAIYDAFDEETLVSFEQRLGFFPALSDVLLLAGDAHTLGGQLDQSEVYYERALALRMKALGPKNKLTLALLEAAAERKNGNKTTSIDQVESVVFGDTQHGLCTKRETFLPNEIMETHKLLRNAQIQQAQTLIMNLVEETSEFSPHLIAACAKLASMIARSEQTLALNILKTVAAKALAKNSNPLAYLSLFANLGFLARVCEDHQTADHAWWQLEEWLDSIQPTADLDAKSKGNELNLGDKLRYLACVFRINNQNDVVDHVLERAERCRADKTMLACDRALLAFRRGEIEKGRDLWRDVITLPDRSKFVDKLLELEKLSESNGLESDREELLKASAIATGRDDARLKLAIFYNSKGRYSDTENLLKDTIKPYSGLHALKIELAESLERQAKFVEALSSYLEIANHMGSTSTKSMARKKQLVLKRAVHLEENLVGVNSPGLVPILMTLFDSFRDSGQNEEAAEVTQRLLELSGNATENQTDDPEILKRLAKQYLNSREQRKYIEVSKRLASVQYGSQKFYEGIRTLSCAASSELQIGQVEEALSDAHLTLDWERSVKDQFLFGIDFPIGGEHDTFTDSLVKANLLTEAERLISHAVDVRGESCGTDSYRVALALTKLVTVRYASNTDFQPTIDRILAIYTTHGGRYYQSQNFYNVIYTLDLLASKMAASGDNDKAIGLLEQLAEAQSNHGIHGLLFGKTLCTLGSIYLTTGNFVLAEKALNRALQSYRDNLRSNQLAVGSVRELYHNALQKLGREDDADSLMRSTELSPTTHRFGVDSMRTQKLMNEAKRAEDIQAKRTLLIEAIDLAENSQGRLSKDALKARKLLRETFERSGNQTVEYYELLIQELDMLKQIEGHNAPETIFVTIEIADFFKKKADFPASRMWTERAKNSATKLQITHYTDFPEFLKLGDKFMELSEQNAAKDLIERAVSKMEQVKDTRFSQHVKQCCSALRKYGFEDRANEIEESVNRW